MIELKGIAKEYNQQLVLAPLDLTIAPHEIFGIVGESGAGKSTLLKIMSLLETPSEGSLFLEGKEVAKLDQRAIRQLKQSIGIVFQQYHLLYNRTVFENISLPLKLLGREEPQKVKELLHFVGLQEKETAYPRQLSGGQKQRVAIARALVNNPKMILCDEPTSALDEKSTADILELLKKVHQEFQPTIVFVSHELAAVKALCQRAAILEAGKLKAITPVKNLSLQSTDSYEERVIARLQG